MPVSVEIRLIWVRYMPRVLSDFAAPDAVLDWNEVGNSNGISIGITENTVTTTVTFAGCEPKGDKNFSLCDIQTDGGNDCKVPRTQVYRSIA